MLSKNELLKWLHQTVNVQVGLCRLAVDTALRHWVPVLSTASCSATSTRMRFPRALC